MALVPNTATENTASVATSRARKRKAPFDKDAADNRQEKKREIISCKACIKAKKPVSLVAPLFPYLLSN